MDAFYANRGIAPHFRLLEIRDFQKIGFSAECTARRQPETRAVTRFSLGAYMTINYKLYASDRQITCCFERFNDPGHIGARFTTSEFRLYAFGNKADLWAHRNNRILAPVLP